MPSGKGYSKAGGMGGCAKFWGAHRIKDSHKQPGNPEASGGYKHSKKPSSHSKISPEKAEKILSDGSVRGHPLSPKQKGFFGAIAGKKRG